MLNNYLNTRKNSVDFFDDFFRFPFEGSVATNLPTDIVEKEDEYVLKVQVAGFNKEDIKLSLDDGYLTIEANKSFENNDEKNKYVRREIYSGTSSRSYYVGDIDQSQIKASIENGILEISVPKKEIQKEETEKYIEIM